MQRESPDMIGGGGLGAVSVSKGCAEGFPSAGGLGVPPSYISPPSP